MSWIFVAVVTTVVSIGAQGRQARVTRKAQKSAIRVAEQKATAREKEIEAAPGIAAAAAKEELRARRRRRTQTVLTSPKGAFAAPETVQKTLLGA